MLQGFRVKNYRALKDIAIGKFWNRQSAEPLTSLVAVIGKNGVGKSTIFDAFGFLADCLATDVEQACDLRQRGGFERLISQGSGGSIAFELYFRPPSTTRPITYELAIGLDSSKRPVVRSERLRQRRIGQSVGHPFSFLQLKHGAGQAWAGNSLGERGERARKVEVRMRDPRQLALATYGALQEHPRIGLFRDFIRDWFLSYFAPDAARSLPLAGPQKHLNAKGDNLGNVVQYMEREHPEAFNSILSSIAKRIPGIRSIKTTKSPDGRLLLQFNDSGFRDPFFSQQMSDGTLKLFAYMLMLADPDPPPFIGIEEPENGLYHKLLATLVAEFRKHAGRQDRPAQIFLTTHQPYLVDELEPKETWILEKGRDGFSTIRHASDDVTVSALVNEGLPLGGLWFSDYLDKR